MGGHIEQRGKDTYRISIYIGKDTDGKNQWVRETFKGDEKAAKKRLAALITDYDRGEYVEPTKLSFGDFFYQWLESAKKSVSIGTYENYLGYYNNHIKKDPVSRINVAKLTGFDLQKFVARLQEKKRADGKPGTMSAKTIKEILAVIKVSLTKACEWKILKENPATFVSAPKIPKYQARVLTDKEAIRFLEEATLDRFYLVFLIAIYTGMRLGEIRALQWDDVNFNNNTIMIRRSVRKDGNKSVFGDTKTEGSSALVSIEPWLSELLTKHQNTINSDSNPHNLVFPSVTGNPIDRKRLDVHYKQVLSRAGVTDHIRFHDLRHSCATLLLQAGVHPKIVSERLRHADIRTTLNKYSHVIPIMQQEANEKMNKMLNIKYKNETAN